MERALLITGANGYLGARLARRHLDSGDITLILWLRAANADEFTAKKTRLNEQLCPAAGRVRYAWGDLRAPEPFSAIDPAEVGDILHAAALTRFNVAEADARQVNIEGTEKLMRFASRCPSLSSFGLISSVYAAGLQTGDVAEIPLADRGFANHYEASKWAAEAQLLGQFAGLPWRIFRVATVIAENESGLVCQYNAVHNTLQLIYHGLISTLPGEPATPLYFVTGEFVTNAVCDLNNTAPLQQIYHLCHSEAESLSLDLLINIAFAVFESEPAFRKRRILKPLYVGWPEFEKLTAALTTFGGGFVSQAVGSVAPFARQLYLTKSFRNDHLRAALADYRAPDPVRLAEAVCRELVRSRWGKDHANVA